MDVILIEMLLSAWKKKYLFELEIENIKRILFYNTANKENEKIQCAIVFGEQEQSDFFALKILSVC